MRRRKASVEKAPRKAYVSGLLGVTRPRVFLLHITLGSSGFSEDRAFWDLGYLANEKQKLHPLLEPLGMMAWRVR